MSIFQETCVLCNFMVSNPMRSFDKSREEICHIQQNIFLPVKDTKTFTSVKKIPFGEGRSATGPTRRAQKGT